MPAEPEANCKPNEALHVLHVHGTADDTVSFTGGSQYLGAKESSDWWATRAGCQAAEPGENIDLDQDIDGAETAVSAYAKGCQPGASVELWSIQEGSHIPGVGGIFGRRMIEYLLTKKKED